MHPLTLHMSAFGPFAAEELIDFSRLGDKPLFLINGPTGSGKTTILDAICFALYGKTTGDEREGSQMRSDLAQPDQLTEVTFTFELAAQRYRIRRVPDQPRPKARGDGFTQQAAEAQFWLLGDDDTPEKVIVGSKVTDATREIEQLLGLSADQFRQVMVLPQGKFRQLLTADSKDREHIFSQLFQTQIYKQLEDELKSRSAEVRREVDALSKQKTALLQNVELDTTEALAEKRSEASIESEHLKQMLTQKQDEKLKASTEKERAVELLARFEQLDRLVAEQQKLAAGQGEIEQLSLQLQRGGKAQEILPEFERYQYLSAELLKHSERLKTKSVLLSRLEQTFHTATLEHASLPELQLQLNKNKQQQQTLLGFQVRVEKLQALAQNQSTAEKAASAAQTQQQAAKQQSEQNTQKMDQAEETLIQLRFAVQQTSALQLEHQTCVQHLQAKQKVEQLQKTKEGAETALQLSQQKGSQLKKRADEQQTTATAIERNWHLAQAAILAMTLQDEAPCPVCGSAEHPSPAHAEVAPPTQAMVEQARKEALYANDTLNAERENYRSINNEITRLSNEIHELNAGLGNTQNITLEALRSQYDLLTKQLETLRGQQTELNKTEQGLITLKAAQLPLSNAVDAAQKAFDAATTLHAEERKAYQIAEQEVPEAYRSHTQLEAEVTQQQDAVSRCEHQIDSLQQRYNTAKGQRDSAAAALTILNGNQEQSKQSQDAAHQQWHVALLRSEFDNVEDFQQSVMPRANRDQFQQRVDVYKQAAQQNLGALQSQQSALENLSRPDMPPYIERIAAAEQAEQLANQQWGVLHDQFTLLKNAEQRINTLQKESKVLEERYAVVGTLSDVANGQTGNKVSLQRFVLSVLLDDVLIEASHRLALMSKGRYRLLRKEDRAKGNRASGLDLEVDDAYTGRVRAVATLSGGESFMAALSLALGLSDVVQAYAGGIRLDTLFIDEGFGSLDPESLDLAVRTLTDLQQSGRMVGIISHVAELKEQISARIDIAASERGSKIVWQQ
ncbi:AAA family ATPase [Neptunomonas antarctica]|uniref:Exonuclease SbcC n=1 Tax=Neptunomonas antarctica TaxID=619304 RepID=A0A1N7LKG0_9GAMM|nr:SMC family ATPase [Neptunomonas antarctica]SIS74306.1 exonuclease SbcC [Neptunomonas antarctica]